MADAKYMLNCKTCGTGFETTYKHRMYCSGLCKLKAFHANNPDKRKTYRATEFAKQKQKQKHNHGPRKQRLILLGFHVTQWRTHLRKQAAAKKKTELASRPCQHCNQPVGYMNGRGRSFCSKDCQHEFQKTRDTYRESTRAARKKRKALERGARQGVNVKPSDIFGRDGWRCQICGKMTPESKRGTYAHNAPELDHIIPVSKGGLHMPDNLQTACRSCNGWKSNRIIPAQRGLFTGLLGAS